MSRRNFKRFIRQDGREVGRNIAAANVLNFHCVPAFFCLSLEPAALLPPSTPPVLCPIRPLPRAEADQTWLTPQRCRDRDLLGNGRLSIGRRCHPRQHGEGGDQQCRKHDWTKNLQSLHRILPLEWGNGCPLPLCCDYPTVPAPAQAITM